MSLFAEWWFIGEQIIEVLLKQEHFLQFSASSSVLEETSCNSKLWCGSVDKTTIEKQVVINAGTAEEISDRADIH